MFLTVKSDQYLHLPPNHQSENTHWGLGFLLHCMLWSHTSTAKLPSASRGAQSSVRAHQAVWEVKKRHVMNIQMDRKHMANVRLENRGCRNWELFFVLLAWCSKLTQNCGFSLVLKHTEIYMITYHCYKTGWVTGFMFGGCYHSSVTQSVAWLPTNKQAVTQTIQTEETWPLN